MSQTKVQLIAPIGVVTASTLETTGVLTATTFVGDIAGTVTGITSTTDNLDVGIVTATAFVGDFTGTASSIVTGSNVTAGIITGTKFVGNATGTVSGLADDTNINVGILTSTSFVGDLTGNAAGLSTTTANLSLGIVTATSFAGNITGNAAGISVTTTNANLGIITASAFHGSGANLSGVSAGPVGQQAVTANSGTTTIDLSSGNVIYMTQSANTTVAFANTEGNTDVVYLIRIKDDTTTARTLTWPSGIVWNGISEPTILQNAGGASKQGQTFKLTTRDNGATWYGNEVVNYDTMAGEYALWTWGMNDQGNLGQNSNIQYSSPVQVPGTDWARLPNGHYGYGVGVMKNNKKIWGWGRNDHGMLGVNISTPSPEYSSPVQIGTSSWATFSVGRESLMASKTDGTLWGWGENYYGNLGLNENNHPGQKSSPTQIPGTTWPTSSDEFAISSERSMAIKTDGTLWMWGRNSNGQLGQNQREGHRSSPVQIPGTTWDKVAQGGEGGAIKTDGTLWMWGYNSSGQLGQNNRVYYSSPVQVGSDTTWRTLYQKDQVNIATKTDGTLWSWGYAHYGCLGHNEGGSTPLKSSPVQIGSSTDWSAKIGLKGTWWVALKTDGAMWGCGGNFRGHLGQNNRTQYSSPVQIPGTWVDVFAASESAVFALR